jgi:PBP superfamily domain
VGRSYTYAPIGIAATVIASWLDNPRSGEPYTDLKLTPRLVTKLITGTYNWNQYGCDRQAVKNPPPHPCNDAVYGNPTSMFNDPDFRQYNPGVNPYQPQCTPGGPCLPTPNPIEPPGTRDLMAFVDQPDAVADDFPTAALQNHEGDFVTASAASMAAAVSDMVTNPDGITKDDNEDASNPDAYPLTMVVYAMVPTSHTPKAEATKIAQWLDYVAGAGQHAGAGAGQLPAGYLPLPAKMRLQTLQAAYDVLAQNGATPPGGYDG